MLPTHLAEAARTVLWEPQPGPQTLLVQCPVFEVFYGGARGGGKTDGSIGDWLIHSALYGEEAIGIFVRRRLNQLTEVIARTKVLFRKIGATYNVQQKEWTMPTGARLRFVYLERDEDAENYQGHNYTRVYIEEATNFPSPAPIQKLKGTLRSAAGVPCGMRLTGNPGGPGHQWVKARYIDHGPFNVVVEKEEVELGDGEKITVEIDRVFIPAKLKDNQKLLRGDPAYLLRLRQTGSAALVKAWLEGNWEGVDGAFFSEWGQQHILPSGRFIPAHWTRFRAMDWGSYRPFSIGWYAVADGSSEVPKGALIRYREWYGVEERVELGKKVVVPNTGLKLSAPIVAQGVRALEATDPRPNYGVADPSIFANNGGPSIGEMMMGEGVFWLRADNSRKTGWEKCRMLLAGERPQFYVTENCEHFLRTVPFLQHDETDPEDLDTDAEDHAADEWRYAVMSRFGPRSLAGPVSLQYPKRPDQMTLNELLAKQREKNQAADVWSDSYA